ncbi:O-antigen ligase family protein [Mariniflexile gromovii]|uniref:O-antigen ligase family protein n=1 Tax=Mariniflexile gromovii TaxID=362523 RepID=A0ABS4BQR2_9FLAO|nr:O-antigen ligase family protein [Mariniflexile gromovii]MBP0902857.1 O-antigen ligase family protein [Mariniflexile gromovii]
MIKKLFLLFIFFAPFTSFFAISSWLRIPVVINQVLFVFLVLGVFIHGKVSRKWILKEDLLLISLLFVVWLSFLFGFKEQRSFNHSLAYTNSIVFYFFVSKYVIQFLNIKAIEVLAVIYKSFLLCSLIIIIDFIGINYFDFSLRRIYAPVVDGKISNMNYFIRGEMLSVAGVAEEPGHMANFYNIYFGLSLCYIYQKKYVKKYKWLIGLFILSQIALFSSAGIALSIFATILIFIINKIEKFSITKIQLAWIVGLLMVFFLGLVILLSFKSETEFKQINSIIDKITFSEEANKVTKVSSSGQRLYQWTRALSNFVKHPVLGNGPGYGVNEDTEGYLSVYFTILSDVGLFAFLFFVSFQTILLIKVIRLKRNVRSFVLFSLITSFLHLIIIADFYQAPLWILFVLIQLIYKENKLPNT